MYIVSIFMLLSSFAITASSTTASLLSLSERERVAVADKACCIVDDILAGFEECCSMLAEQNAELQYEISQVGDKVDSLTECTLGTEITQAMIPYLINQPGHYYLCDSVSSTGAHAITINASNVYLNLNGFTVSSTDMRAITTAGGSYSNVTIENGSLSTVSQRAMEVGGITNFTVRNVAMTCTASSMCFLASITDLVMEDCYMTGNGTGGHGIELGAIIGGRLENVFVNNITLSGFRLFSISTGTCEFINCSVTTANIGFQTAGDTAGILARDCVASNCTRGFDVSGTDHTFENCLAYNNPGAGFVSTFLTGSVFKDCTSRDAGGAAGHTLIGCSNVVLEGCIAQSNATDGFALSADYGGNIDCVLDHCLSINNGRFGFFVDVNSVNTLLAYSTAFGNSNSGIFNVAGATNTFIINCRSQQDAMCCNPAYNMNGAVDVLNGAVEIVES